jgi:hypothetical protein
MRLRNSLWLLLMLAGVCAAQDTNFPAGPQYLITQSSTLFLHSIATPSLSFQSEAAPAPFASPAGTPETVPVSQVEETPPPLPAGINLARVYWGPFPDVAKQAGEVEMAGSELPKNLPASITDVGVTAVLNGQSLRQSGYEGDGTSLGETAAFWKSHAPHASHTYTNKDVQRASGS